MWCAFVVVVGELGSFEAAAVVRAAWLWTRFIRMKMFDTFEIVNGRLWGEAGGEFVFEESASEVEELKNGIVDLGRY